jgi:hypothetical protein
MRRITFNFKTNEIPYPFLKDIITKIDNVHKNITGFGIDVRKVKGLEEALRDTIQNGINNIANNYINTIREAYCQCKTQRKTQKGADFDG